jgi:imidazolonepropionase-like amidohydrolase
MDDDEPRRNRMLNVRGRSAPCLRISSGQTEGGGHVGEQYDWTIPADGRSASPERVRIDAVGRAQRNHILVNVNVVDLERGSILPNQTVIVAGSKIIRLASSTSVRPPRGTRVVQASGKYLMPGLWDADAHLTYGGSCILPVMVAHGITGVRDLGGNLPELRQWQASVSNGRLVGPAIKGAGPNIESAAWLDRARNYVNADPSLRDANVFELTPRIRVADREEARTAVADLQARGVDIVKFRNLGSESFLALAAEAQKRGLLLAGHGPKEVTLAQAAEAGLDSFEHSDTIAGALENLSPAEKRSQLARVSATGAMISPTWVAVFSGDVSEDKLKEAIEIPAAYPYVGSLMRQVWRFAYNTRHLNGPQDWPARKIREGEVLAEAHAAGIKFLTGTDTGILMIQPGTSLHDELEMLVKHVRMTPLEALRASAYNTPAWLGLSEERGLITEGRVADLVLLNSNPLTDIRNSRSIAGVAAEGRWFDRKALDEMLRRARASIAANADCTGLIAPG